MHTIRTTSVGFMAAIWLTALVACAARCAECSKNEAVADYWLEKALAAATALSPERAVFVKVDASLFYAERKNYGEAYKLLTSLHGRDGEAAERIIGVQAIYNGDCGIANAILRRSDATKTKLAQAFAMAAAESSRLNEMERFLSLIDDPEIQISAQIESAKMLALVGYGSIANSIVTQVAESPAIANSTLLASQLNGAQRLVSQCIEFHSVEGPVGGHISTVDNCRDLISRFSRGRRFVVGTDFLNAERRASDIGDPLKRSEAFRLIAQKAIERGEIDDGKAFLKKAETALDDFADHHKRTIYLLPVIDLLIEVDAEYASQVLARVSAELLDRIKSSDPKMGMSQPWILPITISILVRLEMFEEAASLVMQKNLSDAEAHSRAITFAAVCMEEKQFKAEEILSGMDESLLPSLYCGIGFGIETRNRRIF